jgi:hypothetical protein
VPFQRDYLTNSTLSKDNARLSLMRAGSSQLNCRTLLLIRYRCIAYQAVILFWIRCAWNVVLHLPPPARICQYQRTLSEVHLLTKLVHFPKILCSLNDAKHTKFQIKTHQCMCSVPPWLDGVPRWYPRGHEGGSTSARGGTTVGRPRAEHPVNSALHC